VNGSLAKRKNVQIGERRRWAAATKRWRSRKTAHLKFTGERLWLNQNRVSRRSIASHCRLLSYSRRRRLGRWRSKRLCFNPARKRDCIFTLARSSDTLRKGQ